jgi:transcriptional regulator with XRE-family HTH domain
VLANPELHSRLRVERVKKGMTQAEFGRLRPVRLSKKTISQIELGGSTTVNIRRRLAYVLDLDIRELFPDA